MAKKTKATPPSPPRSELSAFRAMLEAELIGRKEARRAAPDYNPAMILMSPFEDERLVLAQYRREHPDDGDVELISYGMVAPRDELCTSASRAAGAALQARMAGKATQEARKAAMPPAVSEQFGANRDSHRAEQARAAKDVPSPAKDVPAPAADAPQPAPQRRNNGSPSEPWLGPHTWMNR